MKHTRTETTARSFTNSPNQLPASPAKQHKTSHALHILDPQHPLLRLKSTANSVVHALFGADSSPEFQSNSRRSCRQSAITGLGISNAGISPQKPAASARLECHEANPFASISLDDICALPSSPTPGSDEGILFNVDGVLSPSTEALISLYRDGPVEPAYAHSDRPYSPIATLSYLSWRDSRISQEPPIGLFPDINMNIFGPTDAVGIDPAAVMDDMNPPSLPTSLPPSSPGPLSESSPLGSPYIPPLTTAITAETLSDIIAILSTSVANETTAAPSCTDEHEFVNPEGFYTDLAALDTIEPQVVFAAPDEASRNPRSQKRKQAPEYASTDPRAQTSYDTDPTPSAPVLNAHLGISLPELLLRAGEYRARYPGEAISQKWLMAYAGKLSVRGELLDDFRCYVIGCTQTNRRRDHILTHVGSHVDQRPFACSTCPMRFLRRNECKRHEASHTGNKPFVCDICFEEKCFSRQDLLKRHLKRTHGVLSMSDKENFMPARKRTKLV